MAEVKFRVDHIADYDMGPEGKGPPIPVWHKGRLDECVKCNPWCHQHETAPENCKGLQHRA